MAFPSTQGIFVFCLVWSVGASCDDLGRVTFDAVVREVLSGPLSEETRACHGILATIEAPPKQLTVPLPIEGTVYQYRFIKEVGLLLTAESTLLLHLHFIMEDGEQSNVFRAKKYGKSISVLHIVILLHIVTQWPSISQIQLLSSSGPGQVGAVDR